MAATNPPPGAYDPSTSPSGPSAPTTPVPQPMPPMPPAPTPRRSRAPLLIAVGVVVLVVVLVLALALAGVLPFFKGSSGGGGGAAQTFGSSRSAAESTASGYSGGPWQLFGAFGVASTSSTTYPLSNLTSGLTGSTCTFAPALGAPTSVSVSAIADVSQGVSNSWLFLFKNGGGTSVLLVSNLGGSASAVGTLGGSLCFGGVLGFFSAIGTNVIDSNTAASTVNSNGGSTFLSAHPGAFASFDLIAGASFLGITQDPMWTFVYSACAFSATATGTAPEFTATVDAATGSLHNSSTSTTTCGLGGGGGGGGTAIDSVLSLGSPTVVNASGAAWTYNVTIASAGSGLVLNDVSVAIKTPGGTAVSLSSMLVGAYVGSSTTPVAVFSSGSWVTGGTASITTSMTISVLAYTYLGGDSLSLLGAGSYSGSISVTLPTG